MQKKAHPVWAAVCILLGLYPLAIVFGVLDVPAADLRAPLWIVALVGLVFVIGGCMVLIGQASRWNDFLAGILCLMFSAMGAWVALYGPAEGFYGGIPLLRPGANVIVSRWVFGIGAVLSLLIAGWAFSRWSNGGGDGK